MDWVAAGTKLRSLAGDDWLPRRLLEAIESESRVFIACSGGADSVFLTLYFARDAWRERLTVLHFNHALRGEESDEDERFTRLLCDGLGVELAVERWESRGNEETVSEDAARSARMAFFRRAIGADADDAVVLTGHHADDVAETMLMRISRGSGLQGLSAPRAISTGAEGLRFVRPLLELRKARLVGWLDEAGVVWREDTSNQEGCYYRNRLRARVIPAWEEAADRPIQEGAIASRALLEEDWEALEACFEEAWKDLSLDDEGIDWERTRALPRGLQRRALNRILIEAEKPLLASSAMEGVLESLRSGETFKVSVGDAAWIRGAPGERIWVEESEYRIPWDSVSVPLRTSVFLPGGGSIEAASVSLGRDQLEEVLSGEISHEKGVFLAIDEKQMNMLRVRQWQPGDAYPPLGRESSVKLKELFIDRKVPRARRAAFPVVVSGSGDILWVPGLPPNRKYLLSEHSTRALQLTYEK